MLIYSMSVSVDGCIADREGAFAWTMPSEEQFRFHIMQICELGGHLCGRRLYETMLPWDGSGDARQRARDRLCRRLVRDPEGRLQPHARQRPGQARLAEASLAEEVAAALDATDTDVSIDGAGLAAAAIELGLVDELRMFRNPVVIGGGTPFLPASPKSSRST
jgi:dihydrofolate reductase